MARSNRVRLTQDASGAAPSVPGGLGVVPFFVVDRHAAEDGAHWGYIDRCPHGMDLGALRLGPALTDARTPEERAAWRGWEKITWAFQDLGNGRCRISPSILAQGVHGGAECHFGPGEFEFMWLEEGEWRNVEPFASRYRARTGREP